MLKDLKVDESVHLGMLLFFFSLPQGKPPISLVRIPHHACHFAFPFKCKVLEPLLPVGEMPSIGRQGAKCHVSERLLWAFSLIAIS